jgi:hypothetical protein
MAAIHAQKRRMDTDGHRRVQKRELRRFSSPGNSAVFFFQFPASFRYTTETMDRLKSLIERFADYPKVMELRHRSWGDIDTRASFNAAPRSSMAEIQGFHPAGTATDRIAAVSSISRQAFRKMVASRTSE